MIPISSWGTPLLSNSLVICKRGMKCLHQAGMFKSYTYKKKTQKHDTYPSQLHENSSITPSALEIIKSWSWSFGPYLDVCNTKHTSQVYRTRSFYIWAYFPLLVHLKHTGGPVTNTTQHTQTTLDSHVVSFAPQRTWEGNNLLVNSEVQAHKVVFNWSMCMRSSTKTYGKQHVSRDINRGMEYGPYWHTYVHTQEIMRASVGLFTVLWSFASSAGIWSAKLFTYLALKQKLSE